MTAAPTTMLEHALAYAARGLAVFPCNPDGGPDGSSGKNPLNANGMNGATTNPDQIKAWWTRWPDALIAARIPEDLVLLDIDPRHGGHDTWTALTDTYGPIDLGRVHASGRCDGGIHVWFRRPPGKLSIRRLDEWARANGVGHDLGGGRWTCGIDILHHHHRYTILPPSPHPATGQPYEWVTETSSVPMPDWLAHLITADDEPAPNTAEAAAPPRQSTLGGDETPADWVAANWTWAQILTGWQRVQGDGETDGSMWRHPAATTARSASIRHELLFVHSTSTPFEPTGPGDPRGYTKFRAYALLHHNGDLRAAASVIRRDHMPRRPSPDLGHIGITLAPRADEGPRGPQEAPQRPSVNLPEEFWEARPVLAHIRQAAHRSTTSADAVLGAVLARVDTLVPPGWDVPDIVGDTAPLNIMVAIIGSSGVGKTQAAKVARRLVPIDQPGVIADLPLGSGEGLAESYFDIVDVDTDSGKTRKERRRVNRAGLFVLDEGGALGAMADRSGATLMTTLRTAWSGDTLGQANASQDTRRIVPAGTYRFALIAGFQLAAAADLLGDAEGGTPQRFEMFNAADPAIPDDSPPWPGRLELTLPPVLIDPLLGADVAVDPGIAAEVRCRRLAINRGETEVDPLDSHDDLCRLKVAMLLAVLDGRRDINTDDWELAGLVRANTKAIRAVVVANRDRAVRDREAAQAQRAARQAAVVGDEQRARSLRNAIGRLRRTLADGRVVGRAEISRSLAGKERDHITAQDLIDHMTADGGLRVVSGDGGAGTKYQAAPGR